MPHTYGSIAEKMRWKAGGNPAPLMVVLTDERGDLGSFIGIYVERYLQSGYYEDVILNRDEARALMLAIHDLLAEDYAAGQAPTPQPNMRLSFNDGWQLFGGVYMIWLCGIEGQQHSNACANYRAETEELKFVWVRDNGGDGDVITDTGLIEQIRALLPSLPQPTVPTGRVMNQWLPHNEGTYICYVRGGRDDDPVYRAKLYPNEVYQGEPMVRWIVHREDGSIGAVFSPPIDVRAMLPPFPETWPPNRNGEPVVFRATCDSVPYEGKWYPQEVSAEWPHGRVRFMFIRDDGGRITSSYPDEELAEEMVSQMPWITAAREEE